MHRESQENESLLTLSCNRGFIVKHLLVGVMFLPCILLVNGLVIKLLGRVQLIFIARSRDLR